jgi:hypothetical protein
MKQIFTYIAAAYLVGLILVTSFFLWRGIRHD